MKPLLAQTETMTNFHI